MTGEDFEAAYAQRSGVTVAWLHEHGLHGYPCTCGDATCEGWQMLSHDALTSEIELGRLPASLLQ